MVQHLALDQRVDPIALRRAFWKSVLGCAKRLESPDHRVVDFERMRCARRGDVEQVELLDKLLRVQETRLATLLLEILEVWIHDNLLPLESLAAVRCRELNVGLSLRVHGILLDRVDQARDAWAVLLQHRQECADFRVLDLVHVLLESSQRTHRAKERVLHLVHLTRSQALQINQALEGVTRDTADEVDLLLVQEANCRTEHRGVCAADGDVALRAIHLGRDAQRATGTDERTGLIFKSCQQRSRECGNVGAESER